MIDAATNRGPESVCCKGSDGSPSVRDVGVMSDYKLEAWAGKEASAFVTRRPRAATQAHHRQRLQQRSVGDRIDHVERCPAKSPGGMTPEGRLPRKGTQCGNYKGHEAVRDSESGGIMNDVTPPMLGVAGPIVRYDDRSKAGAIKQGEEMSDEPRVMSKQDVAKEWALEPLKGDSMLKFDLVVGDERIKGNAVPFSNFKIGDLTDKAHEAEAFLARLLGREVRIETGEDS